MFAHYFSNGISDKNTDMKPKHWKSSSWFSLQRAPWENLIIRFCSFNQSCLVHQQTQRLSQTHKAQRSVWGQLCSCAHGRVVIRPQADTLAVGFSGFSLTRLPQSFWSVTTRRSAVLKTTNNVIWKQRRKQAKNLIRFRNLFLKKKPWNGKEEEK